MEMKNNYNRGNIFNVSDSTKSGGRVVMGKYRFVNWSSSALIVATFTPQELPQSLASGQFWLYPTQSLKVSNAFPDGTRDFYHI